MAEFYSTDICEKSFSELVEFARKANELGELPLLFGGWAVYHYNQYAGSKDVDCIVSETRFDGLVDFLVGKGYGQRELRLFKDKIIFDLYKKDESIGEGETRVDLSDLYSGSSEAYLKGYGKRTAGVQVLIPSVPALLRSKICALAIRDVPKDRSDAIALILCLNAGDAPALARSLPAALKARVVSLRGDAQTLGLVGKPTKTKLKELNDKIRILSASDRRA